MNNSGYSSSEILSMQKDAIERVREMQRRANNHITQTEEAVTNPSKINQSNSHSNNRRQPSPNEHVNNNIIEPERPLTPIAPKNDSQGFLGNLFSSLNLSEDRALILIIIFILLQEGADTPLILALLYLIL